jgi:putative flippase GtrA
MIGPIMQMLKAKNKKIFYLQLVGIVTGCLAVMGVFATFVLLKSFAVVYILAAAIAYAAGINSMDG